MMCCCLCGVQVKSETADAEMKLNNATQRLQRLEHNVTLLKDKALNISLSTEQTNQDAASIREIAEEVKKVRRPRPLLRSSLICLSFCWHQSCSCV